jgi:hypothetical protein
MYLRQIRIYKAQRNGTNYILIDLLYINLPVYHLFLLPRHAANQTDDAERLEYPPSPPEIRETWICQTRGKGRASATPTKRKPALGPVNDLEAVLSVLCSEYIDPHTCNGTL